MVNLWHSLLNVSGKSENNAKYNVCPLNSSASNVIENVLLASPAVWLFTIVPFNCENLKVSTATGPIVPVAYVSPVKFDLSASVNSVVWLARYVLFTALTKKLALYV